MIYTKDSSGFELTIGDKVMAIQKVYDERLEVYRPTLVKAVVYSIGPKMITVRDETFYCWRIYPNQCVKRFGNE